MEHQKNKILIDEDTVFPENEPCFLCVRKKRRASHANKASIILQVHVCENCLGHSFAKYTKWNPCHEKTSNRYWDYLKDNEYELVVLTKLCTKVLKEAKIIACLDLQAEWEF